MKKFTTYFKTLALYSLFSIANSSNAQTPCNSSFVYTITPGGGFVTFSSTATNTTGATVYNWTIYNTIPFLTFVTQLNGLNPSYTFTANGTYSVELQVTNNSPTCTAFSSQTFVITGTNVPCTLSSNFNVIQGTGGAVTLNNTSTGTVSGTTYSWNFGDNTPLSSLLSPVHTYSADGVYYATLVANNNFTYSCSSTIMLQVKVCSVQPLNPSFIYTTNQNGNVTFTSTSTGTNVNTMYVWLFSGTNTQSSGVNLTQASVTYTSNGTYPASLWIQNPVTSCSVQSTQTIMVTTTVTPCNLYAGFTPNQGTNGLVNFVNTSSGTTGSTTYSWNFGDNSTGTSANPVHTYSADGVYAVTIYANNNTVNTCTAMNSTTIKICGYAQLTSSFIYNNLGTSANFVSTSTGTNSSSIYNWTNSGYGFAGGTNVTQALLTFTGSGIYYISLQVVNPVSTCNSTSTQSILVTNTCIANASFSLSPSGTPLIWNALPASPGNVTSAVWSWGDGSTSNTLFTSHSYSAAGTYSICLSVTVSCGATNMYCNSFYVFKGSGSNQNQDVIQINVIDPATVGIKTNGINVTAFTISPNPNNGVFNLKMSGINDNINILVYDLTGKIIYEQNIQSNTGDVTKEINLNEVPAGLYFLKANSDGKVFSKKIVIEK